MNFESTEEQRLLTESVLRFVEKNYGFEQRRRIMESPQGWDPAIWESLAGMGVMGLAFPQEYGGFDGGAAELMPIMGLIGAHLMLEPLLPTILAGRLVLKQGTEEQKKALLPQLAEGKLRLAPALLERGARFDGARIQTQAKQSGGSWSLSGTKPAVVGAPMAEKLVVSAATPAGPGLFLVDTKNAQLTEHVTIDGMRAAHVSLAEANAEPLGTVEGTLEAIQEMVRFGTALACAEAIGAMKSACDDTLEYLKTRKQFGVTIGSFQALQHRMVDMFIASELSHSMTFLACSKVDSDDDARQKARTVSASKIKISESATMIAQEAVQLHGGMGMSEELKVSHTFRRLTVLSERFGDVDYHLARFASLASAA